MKFYPPHHHSYDYSQKYRCPICLHPGVLAYAIEGAKPILDRKRMRKVKRKK